MQYFHILEQILLQGLHTDASFAQESWVFGRTVAQFHGELHAVVKADEVIGLEDYLGANVKHGANLEERVLANGLLDLLMLGILSVNIKSVHPLSLAYEIDTLHCKLIAPCSHSSHAAKTARTDLALTHRQVLLVRVAMDVE